jgi:hypothetical protein
LLSALDGQREKRRTGDLAQPCGEVQVIARPQRDVALDRDGAMAARATVIADARRAGERSSSWLEASNGATVFEHACKLGLEGIVSKRRDAPYEHSRSRA